MSESSELQFESILVFWTDENGINHVHNGRSEQALKIINERKIAYSILATEMFLRKWIKLKLLDNGYTPQFINFAEGIRYFMFTVVAKSDMEL